MTHIQLTTGLIIAFDINECPFVFDANGFMHIANAVIVNQNQTQVKGMNVKREFIVCDWFEEGTYK